MAENHFDLIIIGGRCAGASLTQWLAGSGLKILLLDRSTFPSRPSVPSAPFIHPGTMRLLDELGIPEAAYTQAGGKIEHFVIANFENSLLGDMPTLLMDLDRNYFQGIDRMLFDEALWERASTVPGVTALEGFAVTQILKDETGTISGVIGQTASREQETYTADLVVGADGRFSFCARHFGAKVVEEKNDFTSAAYYADWENMEPYAPDRPNAISTYNASQGLLLLVIPLAERTYSVAAVMQSKEANFGARGVEQAYLERIQRVPHLWNRLKHADRVSEIIGMRPIQNGYREAYGINWALVGDAVHYKDPSDGQGIYDALLGSKLLAQSIIAWKQNGIPWTTAGAEYQRKLMDATHPTFLQTVANVKQTLYMNMPGFLLKTLMRWTMSDPDFQTQFLRYLARAIDPADYKPLAGMPRALIKGVLSDLRKR